MPISNIQVDEKDLKLIHYNLAFKPWHFEDILYKEYFWKYAQKTEFFNEILRIKENYSDEEKFNDREKDKMLRELAQKESDCVGDDRRK
jgi:lipopolysaccharide biosynthesis glycosyltransferase